MKKNKFLASFSVQNLILIAMITAIAIAFKAIAGVLVRMITGPLGIPGGSLAGGFYMLWLPLGIALIDKRGVALLISLVQSLVLLIASVPGSHGIWTFLTYLTPALAVELVMLIQRKKGYNVLHFVFATIIANMIGTFGTNLLFFRMSLLPLMFTLVTAALSGAIGGFVGYITFIKINKTGLLNNKTIKKMDGKNEND